MFTQDQLIIGNAGLYLLFFLSYILRKKKWDVGAFILSIYFISTLSSIYFYNNAELINFKKLSAEPYLFLFLINVICFTPLLKYDSTSVKRVESHGNEKIIIGTAVFLAAILWESTLESLFLCINTSSDSLGKIYMDDIDMNQNLSWLGKKTNALSMMTASIVPCLFFYLLSLPKKGLYQKTIIGLGIAMLAPIFNAYANASRVALVSNLLYIYVVFMFFSPVLEIKIRKLVNRIGLILFSLVIVFLIFVTVSRFNSSKSLSKNVDLLTWVTLYTGEAPLRFNSLMWDMKAHTEGDNSFSYVKDLVGFKTFTTDEGRRNYWKSRTGIPANIFYTYVGDWYSDLGFWGTIMFAIMIYFILKKLLYKRKKEYCNFEDLMLICLITKCFVFGFSYYVYKTYYQQSLLVYPLLFYFFLKFNRFAKK